MIIMIKLAKKTMVLITGCVVCLTMSGCQGNTVVDTFTSKINDVVSNIQNTSTTTEQNTIETTTNNKITNKTNKSKTTTTYNKTDTPTVHKKSEQTTELNKTDVYTTTTKKIVTIGPTTAKPTMNERYTATPDPRPPMPPSW